MLLKPGLRALSLLLLAALLLPAPPVRAWFGPGNWGLYRDAPDGGLTGWNNPRLAQKREQDPDFAVSRWGIWPKWASLEISEAIMADIMRGYPAGTLSPDFRRGFGYEQRIMGRLPLYVFRPNAQVTRAEFLAALRRVLQYPEDRAAAEAYPGIKGAWYEGELGGMLAKGVALPVGPRAGEWVSAGGCWIRAAEPGRIYTQAMPPGRICGDREYWEAPATRLDVGFWLGRAARLEGIGSGGRLQFRWVFTNPEDPFALVYFIREEPIRAEGDPSFSDIRPGEPGAEEVLLAARTGMIKGYPDGTFRPGSFLSRAEAAALLVRLAKRLEPDGPVPDERQLEEMYKKYFAVIRPDHKAGGPDPWLWGGIDPVRLARESGVLDWQMTEAMAMRRSYSSLGVSRDDVPEYYDKIKDELQWARITDFQARLVWAGRGRAAYIVWSISGGNAFLPKGYNASWEPGDMCLMWLSGGFEVLYLTRQPDGRWLISGITPFSSDSKTDDRVREDFGFRKPDQAVASNCYPVKERRWFRPDAISQWSKKPLHFERLEAVAPPEYWDYLRRHGIK